MTACRGPVEVLVFEPPRRLSLALGVGPEVAGLAALVRSLWRSVCGPWSCQSSREARRSARRRVLANLRESWVGLPLFPKAVPPQFRPLSPPHFKKTP